MAYSDYGAFVYKNGERQENREDVPVFGDEDVENVESGGRIWVNLLKLKTQNKLDDYEFYEHCHHAVLGSDSFRICGYKCHPLIYIARGNKIETIPIVQFRRRKEIPEDKWDFYQDSYDCKERGKGIEGEFEDYKFKAEPDTEERTDNACVNIELIEPDGTRWTAISGYLIGAGHEED